MDSTKSKDGKEGVGNEKARNRVPYRKPTLVVYGSLARLTLGAGGSGGDKNMQMIVSDRRAKTDIVRVGSHRLGIGVYLFAYRAELRARFGDGPRLGLMADEVRAVLPEAVTLGDDGYLRVDYGVIARRASAR